MALVLAHRLATPPDEREVPHLQRLLEHRDGEEASVVKVVRLGIWLSVSGRVFRLVQPANVSRGVFPWAHLDASSARSISVYTGCWRRLLRQCWAPACQSNVPSPVRSLAPMRHQRKRGSTHTAATPAPVSRDRYLDVSFEVVSCEARTHT